MSLSSTVSSYEPYLRSLARIMIGFTFSLHGYQKFFGWFGGIGGHSVPVTTMLGAAGAIETFGGAFIILGLFTRPVAFILSGEMAVAYFTAHAPRSFFPVLNGGDAAILFCFVFLFVVVAGPGSISIDTFIQRRKALRPT